MPIDSPYAIFDVADRVAVVTGASSGLGYRFATVLHAAGAQVVAVARRQDRLDVLAAECPGLSTMVVDVEDDLAVDALGERVVREFGQADVVINNAGLGGSTPAELQSTADFGRIIDVNLVAQFRVTKSLVGPMLEAGRGTVINVASVFGFVGGNGVSLAAYCASKGGIVNLTRALGTEWAARGVRVNGLAPGYFASEMTTGRLNDPVGRAWVVERTPMGRPGSAHELDGALLFLASDASSFVTGHTLVVDGGWTAD